MAVLGNRGGKLDPQGGLAALFADRKLLNVKGLILQRGLFHARQRLRFPLRLGLGRSRLRRCRLGGFLLLDAHGAAADHRAGHGASQKDKGDGGCVQKNFPHPYT